MLKKLIPLFAFSVLLLLPSGAQSVFAGVSCSEGSNVYSDGHFTISPLRSCSDGFITNPVFYYGDDLTITYNGDWYCGDVGLGQAVSVELLPSTFSDSNAFGGFFEEAAVDKVAPPGFLTIFQPVYAMVVTSLPAFMDEINNSGIFSITVNLFDQHGGGDLSVRVTCDSGSPVEVPGPTIFLDPSGQVLNACNNQPIQGATVTLFDNIGNPGNEATQESDEFAFPPIMDPQTNPQITPADGTYAWLVLPSPDSDGDGFADIDPILWKVQASAPGFVTQTAPMGNGFPIPPEVTGLNFFLVPENGCPSVVGGKIIPLESTSLILAGAQSFSWMLPVVLSALGIGLFVVSRKSENS